METTKLPSLAPKPGGAPGPDLAAARTASRVAVASSRKTSTTNHACVQCRRTKTKCDGRHPCARCQFNGHTCAYDTRTLSGDRLNKLTHAFNQQKDRLQQLETILAAMRTGTDAEAAEVMAWIRIGEPVESIVSYLESRSKSVVISERSVAFCFVSMGVFGTDEIDYVDGLILHDCFDVIWLPRSVPAHAFMLISLFLVQQLSPWKIP